MNIFFLDPSPEESARMMVDCHVNKMTLEAAQIAMTVYHIRGVDGWAERFERDMGRAPYRKTHERHPMVKWAATSRWNLIRAMSFGKALASEYTRRTGRIHSSEIILEWCQCNVMGPMRFNHVKRTLPPLCMPDEFKTPDLYESYQNYYLAKLEGWMDDPKRCHLVKGGIAG